jgi:competence protein ComEC
VSPRLRRLLPALVCAQAIGILLADRDLLRVDAARVLGATALGLALAWGRARLAAALVAALAAGAAGLGARIETAERFAPRRSVELALEASVRAVSHGASGWRVELADAAATEAAGPRPPPRVRLLGPPTPAGIAAFEASRPGERVRLRARLARPGGRHNPGRGDPERDARRAGVGAVGGLVHPAYHARLPGSGALGGLHAARARAGQRLAAAGPGGGLLRALALGEQGVLASADRDAFAALGLAHLLSVSGLHLALVAALSYAVLVRSLRRCAGLAARRDTRRIALLAALAAACVYALVSGWGVPVRRSLVMLAALALSALRARPSARLAPLWLAALAVLAVEPEALFSAGAQLSFAASAALVASRPAGAREAHGLRGLLRASATALAVTAPLAAAQLGSRAPFALAANLVFVPWTGWAVLPAALAAALAAALDVPGAGAIAALAERLAAATLALARVASAALPGGTGPGQAAPAAPWLVASGLLAAAALRARSTAARAVLALAISAVLAVAPPPAISPAPPRVVVLDVGQGDAVLVQGRRGAILVDAGTAVPDGADLGAAVVVPALRALGVRRLDLVAASHADLDHRGGLPAVLRAVPVARVWLPRGGLADPGFAELRAAARAAGAAVEDQGAGGVPLLAGDLRVEALWPPRESSGASRNDRSLTLRVELAGRAVLLPGDLEAPAEAQLLAAGAPLRADVLKLAHHGSRTSSTSAWLAAVDGAVAIASAPRAGRFGMPHPEVVARARAAGYALWWTGRDGAVLIGLDAPLHVRGWRRR